MAILQDIATFVGFIVITIVIVVPWAVGVGTLCAEFKDIFERALPSWLERDITCPIEYTYNLFPLNANQCILRI